MHRYPLSIGIFSLQARELHVNLQPQYQQKGLASEYISSGLEYFLGPYK